MTLITNQDRLYLSKAIEIEKYLSEKRIQKANGECKRLLEDPYLPFYYQGQLCLVLSADPHGDEQKEYALQAIIAFNRMLWQSDGDAVCASYVVRAHRALRRIEQTSAMLLSNKDKDMAENIKFTAEWKNGPSVEDLKRVFESPSLVHNAAKVVEREGPRDVVNSNVAAYYHSKCPRNDFERKEQYRLHEGFLEDQGYVSMLEEGERVAVEL